MVRKSSFVLFLIGVFSLAAHAAVPFFTGQGNDISFRSFEDDQGGFYLAWIDAPGGQAPKLLAQHIGADGRSLWDSPGLAVTSQLSSIYDWSGLADGQGGLTLFWDELDGVHAQRFRPDGTRRRPGNSVRMSSSTFIQPDAVADASGGTLVVWREILSDKRSVLKAQRLDTEGKPVWPAGGLRVCLRASSQTNPRVIYDNMSGMIVAWRDEANSASELRVQRIDFSGNLLWGLEGIKIMAPVGASDFPIIAPVGTGAVVVAWTGPVDQRTQIFLQKVGPDPKPQWGPTSASKLPLQYNRWNPVLLGDEAGGTWIGWEDFRNQVNYQIQLNHLRGDASSVWPGGEISVAPFLGEQGKTAMINDGQDGVWVAWIDNRLATIGLYVQDVAGSGQLLQGPAGRKIADGLNKPSFPQLVSVGPNKAVVSWTDRPKKGQWSLNWAFVDVPAARP